MLFFDDGTSPFVNGFFGPFQELLVVEVDGFPSAVIAIGVGSGRSRVIFCALFAVAA